ncbi:RNA methyltransferase [Solibacillus daqui]|uniref:RNA methyltransferase n=1 Tax=Solibacillus daqui TaxID=2912187 RepID=UPI0023671AA6|nr:RNA methyltransferase [Solibacillus daqui]
MKKLFEAQNMLSMKQFERLRFDGMYALEQITEQQYACQTDRFHILIEAKKINVQHLFDSGFLLDCESLQKLVIERIS